MGADMVGSATRWRGRESSAVLGAIYLALLALTWGKWPDAQVDYGHELYSAWQLSDGQIFGRDLWLVATGPLSPHVNALLFRAFGAEIRVLVAFNLLILALLTWLLYVIVNELSETLTATIACAGFLAIFAFGQYFEVGNYNYVTPYSHGATHGLALALLSVWLLHRWGARPERLLLITAGMTGGLVFLTKPEIFVALGAAVAVWWAAFRRTSRDCAVKGAASVLIASALIPPAVMTSAFLVRMPLQDAWHAAVLPWLLLATPFARTPFYVAGMGLDAPGRHLAALASWGGACAGLLVLGVAAELAARRLRVPARIAGLGLFPVVLLGLVLLVPTTRWLEAGRPLPVIVLAGAVVYAARVIRSPSAEATSRTASLGLTLAVLAFGLLGKMVLNARLVHYGFVLAVPAFMLGVTWIWWSVPNHLRARGLDGAAFRGVAGAVIALMAAVHVGMALPIFRSKEVRVGAGGNAFLSDERGALVNEAVRLVAQAGRSGSTLTVLPEGVMVNFLTQRTTPSPYLAYTPEMIAGFGEEAMLAPLRRAPPDHVVLISRDASEYGARTFGRDYGVGVMRWVEENYAPVARAGGSPMEPGELGVLLLERKSATGAVTSRAPRSR